MLLEDPWQIQVNGTLHPFAEWREKFVREIVELKSIPDLYKLLLVAAKTPTEDEIRSENEHRTTIANERAAKAAWVSAAASLVAIALAVWSLYRTF